MFVNPANDGKDSEREFSAHDEKDEFDILANQDETDPGGVNNDDRLMGAGPTNELNAGGEPDDFVRGEVDVKEQMDRAHRAIEYPNRGTHPPNSGVKTDSDADSSTPP